MDAKKVLARSELEQWLVDNNAKRVWRAGTGSSMIVDYMLIGNGTMFVLRWSDGSFELFTPLHDDSINRSFADALERVGLGAENYTLLVNRQEYNEALDALNAIREACDLPDDTTIAELPAKVRDAVTRADDSLVDESLEIAKLLGVDTTEDYDLVEEVRQRVSRLAELRGKLDRKREDIVADVARAVHDTLIVNESQCLDDRRDRARVENALLDALAAVF